MVMFEDSTEVADPTPFGHINGDHASLAGFVHQDPSFNGNQVLR